MRYCARFCGLLLVAALLPRPGSSSEPVDPVQLLRAARDAMKDVRTVSYEATAENLGPRSVTWPPVSGRVHLARMAPGTAFDLKVAMEAESYARGTDQKRLVKAAFDGRAARRWESTWSRIREMPCQEASDCRRALGHLGGHANRLILWQLTSPLQPEHTLVEYDGRAAVAGVLCEVVYIEDEREDFEGNKQKRSSRWFFGVEDHLPRRRETYSVDDAGRVWADVLRLSNLVVDAPMDDSVFELEVPGFDVETVEGAPDERAKDLLDVGSMAPEWSLRDPAGESHALRDYRGKVVILDFWASWCGPCKVVMPGLQTLHEEFAGRGVSILGVDQPRGEEGEAEKAINYMKTKGYTYGLLLDGDELAETYRVPYLPTLYVIGVDGRILHREAGLGEQRQRKDLARAMQERTAELRKIIEEHLREHGGGSHAR